MKANKTYAEALLQKQELNKVDGISGATLSYKQFFDAAQRAGRSGQIIIVIGNV
ncbi:MAG: FMN-binding protein [Dialister invisus]